MLKYSVQSPRTNIRVSLYEEWTDAKTVVILAKFFVYESSSAFRTGFLQERKSRTTELCCICRRNGLQWLHDTLWGFSATHVMRSCLTNALPWPRGTYILAFEDSVALASAPAWYSGGAVFKLDSEKGHEDWGLCWFHQALQTNAELYFQSVQDEFDSEMLTA
jgi:hypothetical protein